MERMTRSRENEDSHLSVVPRNENETETEDVEDDEIVDRYEYEIEQSVDCFVDEKFRGSKTYPESSDEEEDDLVRRNKRMRKTKHDTLVLGTTFHTGFEFKETVLEYAFIEGRNIRQDRWDKTKISFRCGIESNCKWRVYCSLDKVSQKWLVKTRYNYHSCIE